MEHRDPKGKLKRDIKSKDKPFAGMIISLSGRLSRTHVCNMFLWLFLEFYNVYILFSLFSLSSEAILED